MQQVLAANKSKKLEKRKFSQAYPLSDFFHYEGESPNVKRNNDGAIIRFSTPVKVWMDNEDNYSHLYYRSEEHTFHCAVPGCDFSHAPVDHRNGNISAASIQNTVFTTIFPTCTNPGTQVSGRV
jgi:hypothetical protein